MLESLQHRGTHTVARIWVAKGSTDARIRKIVAAAKASGVPVEHCTRRELDRREPTVPHQGVIARVSRTSPSDLSAVLAKIAQRSAPALFLMLDTLQDPRNFGAVLRTAEAVAADAVIVPKNNAVGVTPAVHKASAGASAYVPIITVTNLTRTIETLKNRGIWVVGAAAGDGSAHYTTADFRVPLCLVFGSEGKGIRRLVKQTCDYLVHLPMFGRIESLNVSVAAGVLLYEVVRQRAEK